MSLIFGDDMFCQYAQSRAVDVDYDDDEQECMAETAVRPFMLSLSPGVDTKSVDGAIPCTSLIIAIGPVPAGFIEAQLLDSSAHEVIGCMHSDQSDDQSDDKSTDRSTDKSCLIYRLTELPHVLIVQCHVTVNAEQSYSFTQQLMSSLSLTSAHVIILSTGNRSEYKCERPAGGVPDNFLRMLHSQAFLGSLVCAPVEQPNTVDGLPAQLLTHCQINGLSCALYVCYTNVLNVDLDTLKAFNNVLLSEPFNLLSKGNVDAERRLSKVAHKLHAATHSSSFIYM